MDLPDATTTLRGGHLRAPSTQAVDIDERDAFDRIGDERAARLERSRGELLKHALDPAARRARGVEPERNAEHLDPPPQRTPPSTSLLAHVREGAHLTAHRGRTPALPPSAERPRHRAQPIAQTRRYPSGHHRHHRAAATAEVPPHHHLRHLGNLAGTGRPELKPPSDAVADQS